MEHLLEFCQTERQKEILETRIKYSAIETARKLNIAPRNVYLAIQRIKKNAAKNGVDPDASLTHRTAHGFATKRVSTNYDAEGGVKQQWHIQEPDKAAKLEALLNVLESYEYKPAPTDVLMPTMMGLLGLGGMRSFDKAKGVARENLGKK